MDNSQKDKNKKVYSRMQDIIDFEEISDENEYMQIEWLEDYDDTEIDNSCRIDKLSSEPCTNMVLNTIIDIPNCEQIEPISSHHLEDTEKTKDSKESDVVDTHSEKKSDNQSKILINEKGKKKSKQESRVWDYFEKEKNLTARCILCNKLIKHCGNTSNMKQHLTRKHEILWTEKHKKYDTTLVSNINVSDKSKEKVCSEIKVPTIKDAFDRERSFTKSGRKSDEITNIILYMLAVDKMALTTVENKGFKRLMKTVIPLYKMPSRKTMTKLVEVRYATLKNNFIIKIGKAICYNLTCDNWTDITNQSYLGVTIHNLTEELKMKSGCVGVFPLYTNHTAEYLAKSLNIVIEEFKLDRSKITAIITDSAANIKLAIEKVMGKEKHLCCFAHILSHLVPDALSSISDAKEIIYKVKKIVTIVRRSIVASDELKNLQLRDGKTEGTVLTFIQDVATRWNSTLYMLNRFLELEQYVYPVISKCNNPPDMLRRDEIKVLKEMISIMRPIERAIVEISGESYPTCSTIIPLVRCMKIAISCNKPDTKVGNIFKEKLQSAIENRCKNLENNKIMSIATLLDPRFKKLHFENSLAAVTAVCHVESDLKFISSVSVINVTRSNTDMIVIREDKLWDFHDNLVARNNNLEELDEIQQYLKQPIMERQKDPFEYWKSVQHIFPNLYQVAVKYISILGTSVPSERIFSQAGDIKYDERSRLTSEHLNMLLFLSSLNNEDWGFE